VIAFQQKPKMAKAGLESQAQTGESRPGVVVDYAAATRTRGRASRKELPGAAVARKRVVGAPRVTRRADVALAR
jgi:hypothetical protein